MVPTHYFLLISFDSMRDGLFWERQTTFGQLLFFFFFFKLCLLFLLEE